MLQAAQILSPWVGAGAPANPYRPELQDLALPLSWCDATGQPATNLTPNPNLVLLDVTAAPAIMDQLAADTRFFILSVGDLPIPPA